MEPHDVFPGHTELAHVASTGFEPLRCQGLNWGGWQRPLRMTKDTKLFLCDQEKHKGVDFFHFHLFNRALEVEPEELGKKTSSFLGETGGGNNCQNFF